jgi:hypothetical protein
MKTPEEYYKSLCETDINCPINKYREFNFSSVDIIRFTKGYLRDIVLPYIEKIKNENT